MKNFLKLLWILSLLILVVGCIDDDSNNNEINGPAILDFLKESPDHRILVNALELTQLDFNLEQRSSLTVFAPTDEAFTVFLAANDYANVTDIPVDLLRTLLLYHIQSEIKTTERLDSQYYKTQAQVGTNQLDVFVLAADGSILINNEARITNPNNLRSNGIVHVIDNVRDLPSVYTLIAANPAFSNLETALDQEGLSIALRDSADVNAPFTLFAPSDIGFTALIDEDDSDDLNSIEDVLAQDNLDDQLLYHVLGNQTLRQDDFMDNAIIDPLGEGTFTLNTVGGVSILDGSSTTTNVIASNITALNGVIHTLDFVLRQQD